MGASANYGPTTCGRLPNRQPVVSTARTAARPPGVFSVRLDAAVLAQFGQLLSLAEHRERGLRLRIGAYQMTPRVGDAEHRVVDLEADHRLDEVEVLLEGVFVDLDLVRLQLLAE